VAAEVQLDLVGEDAEAGGHELGCAVGVTAGSTAFDLLEPPIELRVRVRLAAREPLERVGDRGEAVDARSALARARGGQVSRHARRLDNAAGA
jgi:hypothetical protein